MKHTPRNECGISDYKCVGLQKYLKTFNITSNNVDWDAINSIPDTYTATDEKANNFYNVPRTFQGVINSTPYKDLKGAVDAYIGLCNGSYDIFGNDGSAAAGFSDYYGKLKRKLDVNPLVTYYINDTWQMQRPGVLLPVATLSQFNPSPIITVPSWVGVLDIVAKSITTNNNAQVSQNIAKAVIGSNQSPCYTGFWIKAYIQNDGSPYGYYALNKKSVNVVIEYISEGIVDVSGLYTRVPDMNRPQTFTFGSNDFDQSRCIQIYAILQFQFSSGYYLFKRWDFCKEGSSQAPAREDKPYILPVYIATVQLFCRTQYPDYTQCALRVSQPQCSPVLVQNIVLADLHNTENDDKAVYVYTYKAKSSELGWMKVVNCQ